MTTTGEFVDLVVTALKGNTVAGQSVYSPLTWPTWNRQYPLLRVRAIHERKQSQGPVSIQFDVTSTIRVTALLTAPAQLEDGGAEDVQADVWKIQREIEIAVINSPILMRDPVKGGDRIKQYPTIETVATENAEGKQPIGELMMDIAIEHYQGPEDFAPNDGIPLTEVQISADLVNVADPSGTYVPKFAYPVTKAPRTHGPDGRAEAALDLILPQK